MNKALKAKKAMVFLIAFAVFFNGCVQENVQEKNEKEIAIQECQRLCNEALTQGKNLQDGPCLSSGEKTWTLKKWVCDVAHSPRKAVDNLKENQCPEFGVNANSFVEFSPECRFIRAFEGK